MISELRERGFVVLDWAVGCSRIRTLADAYDRAVANAIPSDIKVGSSSTRVTDFVNRGSEFDDVYLFSSLLEAARAVIGPDFKLSSFHARTLRPLTPGGDDRRSAALCARRHHSARWPCRHEFHRPYDR